VLYRDNDKQWRIVVSNDSEYSIGGSRIRTMWKWRRKWIRRVRMRDKMVRQRVVSSRSDYGFNV
jgi:hypothetical protein